MHLIQSLKNEFCFDLPMFSKYLATSINSYFYKITLTTGCSIMKVTKYWAVKPIKNVILRLSNSLKPPKIWDILTTSQVFSKGGLKFPFKASRSQIPKYLFLHNTGW